MTKTPKTHGYRGTIKRQVIVNNNYEAIIGGSISYIAVFVVSWLLGHLKPYIVLDMVVEVVVVRPNR